ncbi:asparagine-rich protein, putative [Schistosoma mansoni]|uniref:asparagine-rich protein, putative n=1 Tax=Schistosoma mansoni TaxID=6183 RepID=UPI00022C8389|nr:asparagine-rich protein, putative [Schistosoma mansoni]|eukprot:XP_018645311.1 asparagine-rich protein, putative [Schistosoma mansoni]
MSTNHDVYKPSSILSSESIDLKMQNYENNWSTLNNHDCTWTSSCNTSVVSDTSSNYTSEYYKPISSNANNLCSISIHDPSSSALNEYLYNGSNIFQSLKSINTPSINTYNNTNGDPLDYSIHSSMNSLKDPIMTFNQSHIQLQSNYIHSSINQMNQDESSYLLKNTTTSINSSINTQMNNGQLLKPYKYLTWREKDRRRRFREEWKHLWLVIPYGLYEVMCLVCHKVMTQRKVDTIKRHTVRRHVELIGMSESEREKLFNQLIKQYTMLGVANYNSSTDIPNILHRKSDCLHQSDPTKNCDEISNVKSSSEILTNDFNNTNKCLLEKHSIMNRLKNIDTKNDSLMSRDSDFRHPLAKQDKQLDRKLYQTTKMTPRYSRNSCSKKYRTLPEVKQDRSITEDLKGLSKLMPEDWDDPSIFQKSFPLQNSPTDTPRHYCNRLEYPHNEDRFYIGTLGSKVMPSSTNSMMPSFSPFSTVVPISKCSSCIYPSKSENFHNFLKSYVSMNSLLSSPNMPTSSISSLLMPQIFSTLNNSYKLSTSMKSTSSLCTNNDISCHTGSGNRDNNNNSTSANESHRNYRLSPTEIQTTVNDYRKRSNQLLDSSINTQMSLTSDILTNNIKNIKVPCIQQFSTQNIYKDSHSPNLQISPNSSIPGSLPFMMSTFMTDLLKHEKDDGILPKMPESRINTLVNKRNSVHMSNPELFNDCPNDHKTSDRKTNFISREGEHVVNPSGIKSNSKSKSNSGSKQFTISSLLNIENLSSENKASSATHHDELIPDIQKKDTISLGCNCPNWSTQNPQEKRKTGQLPIPCVLCNSESANNCTDEVSKQFISNVTSGDNLFRSNTGSIDISITKQIDAFRERQSAFSSPTGLPNVSVNRKLLEHYTSIPELYQSYTDIFHLIYCLKNQIPINCLSNSNTFHNQNSGALETYMKSYYLELLRHQYDVPSTDLSTQRIPTTLCSSIHKENELVNFKKCTNELQKSSIID